MRILISADIEGISGVMSPDQTRPGSAAYERARLLMTREVNAAVEGALDGGPPRSGSPTGTGNTTTSCWRNSTPARVWCPGSPGCSACSAGWIAARGTGCS